MPTCFPTQGGSSRQMPQADRRHSRAHNSKVPQETGICYRTSGLELQLPGGFLDHRVRQCSHSFDADFHHVASLQRSNALRRSG